ncbi:MAG: sigma-54-dependent Fis family transcriptional regulator [Alphaproteobacteria bacterium]|nr:sigma-54-dependent Fis family transcriptional regulator [Alphaproteobacteria bacterium]
MELGAGRELAECVRAAAGATPVYGFARAGRSVDADWLVDTGIRDVVSLPAEEALLREIVSSLDEPAPELIARSPELKRVVAVVDRVAQSDAPVLVIGETGTGKEVIARHVHRASRRASGPFVSINCAAIPEQLLESELFGHEKGAFTGALARRLGKFEEAAGGTLLLDEIGEMDLKLQAKLLRAIQERQIDRVGGRGPVSVDLRIVATTNRDLMAEVEARRFREDLYYRLNVINVELPPLRERPLDIAPLAEHFVQKHCARNTLPPKAISPGAMARLEAFDWPGNVRELENTMYRAVLIANSASIEAEDIIFTRHQGAALASRSYAERVAQVAPAPAAPRDLPAEAPMAPAQAVPVEVDGPAPPSAPTDDLRPGGIGAFVGRSIAEIEEQLIKATLEHCYGNRTRAATILGISIQTLRNKLERYGA